VSTTIHCCISVRGMLRWDRREAKRMLKSIKKGDGTPFVSVDEFRDAMMTELTKCREVLPMSDECVGFDYVNGCPGHPAP
jgi:hypothetical protein